MDSANLVKQTQRAQLSRIDEKKREINSFKIFEEFGQIEEPELLRQKKKSSKVIEYMPGKSQAIDRLVNTSSFVNKVDSSEIT